MRHRTVDLDGPVHYLDFGGEGPPLLMVHGLAGNALNWMAVGTHLAAAHRTIAMDLAGFGRTPLFHRSAAVGANTELVHTFIEEVIGEPTLLMGNSMGGHIAILEAARHPQSVTGLVLVDPAVSGIRMYRPEPRLLGVAAAISVPGLAQAFLDRRMKLETAEALVQRTLALVCVDVSRVPREVVEAHVMITGERLRLGPQSNRALLQATRSIGLRMADPRFWARVREVSAPTLVIHGDQDRVIPLSSVRELARRRPDWALEVLAGVGHVPMMETPELFLSVVNQWKRYKLHPQPLAI